MYAIFLVEKMNSAITMQVLHQKTLVEKKKCNIMYFIIIIIFEANVKIKIMITVKTK